GTVIMVHPVTLAGFRQTPHPDSAPDRELEPLRVRLKVVSHLVLGRKRPTGGREVHAGQIVITGRAVEPQRVPVASPVVSDALIGIDDQKAAATPLQVVADGQTCLACTDDQGFDPLAFEIGHGGLLWLRVALATSRTRNARNAPGAVHRAKHATRRGAVHGYFYVRAVTHTACTRPA